MVQLNRRNLPLLPQKAVAKLINLVDQRITPFASEWIARIQDNRIAAYWWTGERNFGDLLTPALLKAYGLTPVYCHNANDSQIASTGSIIGRLPADYSGIVLGSGLLSDNRNLRLPLARILALRGELTKERLQVNQEIPLGDPGLLCSDLLRRRDSTKKTFLGIVPHYEDRDHEVFHALSRRYKKEIQIINVQRSPRSVVKDIDSCQHILSSSLHGIVVADALDIPNCWTALSSRVIGKGFKFRDYYSAFGVERSPFTLNVNSPLTKIIDSMATPPADVERRRTELRNLFQQVVSEFSSNKSLSTAKQQIHHKSCE